jgi:16S rRNA (cytosine967-C5)-methyltransferase
VSGAVSPARRAAFDVVLRTFESDAYADRALTSAAAGLDARDRALAQRIAFGTIQLVRVLDHGIEALGRRPVRKLDPPVRAALRIGAYQLAELTSVPPHAAVGESVELVRAAGLERAVAFTNAVLRRLTVGLRGLIASLPDGPLKLSYPDWVYEVWERDLGRQEALALMRGQNEAAETVVRLVRGEIDGEATDVPGAFRVDRVDERALAEGRIWPQSRASQLAGLLVGSREGERTLDLCAAPGGKATMLAGEVVAVEKHEGRARELEENRLRLGATNVRVVHADALELPADLTGFARRRAVLGPRRPRPPPRPALASTAAPRAPARSPPRRRQARAARRHDPLLGLHDQRGRERGARRRVRPRARAARRRVAPLPSSHAAGVPPHPAAPRQDVRLLHRTPPSLASESVLGVWHRPRGTLAR